MAVQLLCVFEQEQDVSENKLNGDAIWKIQKKILNRFGKYRRK